MRTIEWRSDVLQLVGQVVISRPWVQRIHLASVPQVGLKLTPPSPRFPWHQTVLLARLCDSYCTWTKVCTYLVCTGLAYVLKHASNLLSMFRNAVLNIDIQPSLVGAEKL